MPRRAFTNILLVGLLFGANQCRPAAEQNAVDADTTTAGQGVSPPAPTSLSGTHWRLVKFQGGDGATLTPDDKSKYTLEFGTEGRVSARIDCNRGSSTWTSTGPSHLEFGPLALTKMMCPPGSLHDHIVKQWPYVRSHVIRDGHLFLSLQADGGIYEFEPTSPEARSNQ